MLLVALPSWGAGGGPHLANRLDLPAFGLTLQYPDGWSAAPKRFANMHELINVPADRQETAVPTARVKITTETRRDHREALRRLQEIMAGTGATAQAFMDIGGWPALQTRRLEDRPQPGKGAPYTDEKILRITTAVAVGRTLFRLEAGLPSDAGPVLVAEAEAIARSLVFALKGNSRHLDEELNELRRTPPRPPEPQAVPGPENSGGAVPAQPSGGLSSDATALATMEPAADFPQPGLTRRVITGNFGELEIAVSPNAQIIVIGQQSLFSTSQDGGQTFPFNGSVPFGFGDPSVAYGRSGNIYYAGIRNTAGCGGSPLFGCATGIARSTNNGQTFPDLSNAVVCPNSGPGRCFPDQEHIAADRWNAAPGGGDQVYSTWRNFDATDQDPGLVCSQDSGVNWTAPITVGAGAFPRIGVGPDGFVYVVYLDGGNYMLHKFSSCGAGLIAQGGFPVVVGPRNPVDCPFVGHDRCDQNPSSQTVAVDDTNPNHVYFAYASNTAPGNEDIRVRDSLDGGMTWPGGRVVRVNTGVPGKRIMPWACATGGEAFVTWYDRRAAPASQNDLTDYFGGRASLDGGGSLVAGADFKISPIGDPWCASGWPCGTRSTDSSDQCSVQPQLAGFCGTVSPCCAAGDSAQRCDFNQGPPCPAGESCRTAGGCPKYGDYNGSACAAGRLIAGWASATSPPGITPPSTSIDIFTSATLLGNVPRIQVPGNVTAPPSCVGGTTTTTLEVCNTGNANLEVAPITSSSTQFAVTTPVGGYPVIVSPDFCFPFQVRFSPTSIGPKSATLTIPTNDPANPSVTIQASGNAAQPRIATILANNGDFGDVCRGSFKDLPLTLSNSGGCDLSVSGISSSSLEFQAPWVMPFPLVIAPGDSLQVPLRFRPTTLGAKAATFTISSNDPTSPAKVVPVTGNVPSGDVVVTADGEFGDVCAGTLADKRIPVCNVGLCTLNVTGAAFVPPCPDFRLLTRWFPAPVSHDFCLDLLVRFTPTSAGPKTCNLVITTDDPDTPTTTVVLTANTPIPSIDVPADLAFPPTVIQSVGTCMSSSLFPVSNTGTCNLDISAFSISDNPAEFSISGLPSFPIILEPGHVAGEGALRTVFAPTSLDRDVTGQLTVTYVSDPITGSTTSISRSLCGEGVRTGARVLVRAGGSPLPMVESIQLQRINANRNKNLLDTVDVAKDLALQSVTPAAPCRPFQYHREYSTVDNPIQLLPGVYQVTATAIVNGRREKQTVGFDVTTCDFNPSIVIDF